MTYKKWFITTLIIILLPLFLMGAFNYYIDPLWSFSHEHNLNDIQMPFNERQQKTNYITFHDFDYDTLILGSSRTTYIDQNDFEGLNAYNYSVSNMVMEEYYDYIEYAKKQKGSDFDYIIIGIDFMATNKNLEKKFEMPSFYINKTNEPAYRYKTLLAVDTLEYSLKNYRASKADNPVNFAYDRHNIKTLLTVTDEERARKIQNTLDTYQKEIYANYEYTNVKEIFTKIKESNPNTKFIIFTTPVSKPLLDLIAEEGLSDYYQRWLRDTADVFGEVYHFMYPNSITTDLNNYYDASHFYPHIGTLIAHKLTNTSDPNLPPDFGTIITLESKL